MDKEKHNLPMGLSEKEWVEIAKLDVVKQSWGLTDLETIEVKERLQNTCYGVKFDFVSGCPNYCGELYILQGDGLAEPMRFVRKDGELKVLNDKSEINEKIKNWRSRKQEAIREVGSFTAEVLDEAEALINKLA